MRLPIILLSGQAGSGKDTVASFLVKRHGAVAIAQADPMKELAATLFGFSRETLWGPSERRNDRAPYRRWCAPSAQAWLESILPGQPTAELHLERWFRDMPAGATARHVLQTLGTEWGRAFSRDMWADYALRRARALLAESAPNQCDGCAARRPVDANGNHRMGSDAYPDLLSCQRSRYAPPMVVITDGRFRNEVLAVRQAGGATIRIESPGSGLTGSAAQHASEQEQAGIPEAWFDAILVNDKDRGLRWLEAAVGELASAILPCPRRLPTAA